MTNQELAKRLREWAEQLGREGGSLYRVRALRGAAFEVDRLERSVQEVFESLGRAGLESLPGVGKSVAYTIEGFLTTGELRTLRPADSFREPFRVFTTLPGVGPRLAEQLYHRLKITSLEELADALRAGRLEELAVGKKRLEGLLLAVDSRLERKRQPLCEAEEPRLADLLLFDQEYRRGTEEGSLPRLAPLADTPEGQCWLGVLRQECGGWRMRSTFSNTALAHRLAKTGDWVVIYFERGVVSGQRTVVTETGGDLIGLRVVRGREEECRRHYSASKKEAVPDTAA